MKLSNITEGVVSTSRGRIVDAKNDVAELLVTTIRRMGVEPNVEYADSVSDDAIIYVDIGGQTVMVQIISDDDIQVQLPEPLARVLRVPDYVKLGDPSRVGRILRKILAAR